MQIVNCSICDNSETIDEAEVTVESLESNGWYFGEFITDTLCPECNSKA